LLDGRSPIWAGAFVIIDYMRVLVTGSTSWTDRDVIRAALSKLPKDTVVVTGDTEGVDAIAIDVARDIGLGVDAMRKTTGDVDRYPGESWKGLNERMINSGVELVLAFHPEIDVPGKARGTRHVIELAGARLMSVEIIRV